MKKLFPFEFLYMTMTLLLTVVVVQSVYMTVIRPRAEAVLAAQEEHFKQDPMHTPPRSVYVILRDYEQETAFILAIWSVFILAYRGVAVARERSLLEQDFVGIRDGQVLFPEDSREFTRRIEALPAERQAHLLPRTINVALNRFGATGSIQDAATAVRDECEFEASKLDAELSMVRFTVWAIPAVGFVGTVRGIGAALQEAQRAAAGDVTGVTHGLGVTFNATLTALILCITVMFFLHQLQMAQDRLVLDTKRYVDTRLIRHFRTQRLAA
ncbi:MAG: MotA/TolQ/ExbB proton channel family protein [Gammaproteobacteria bacterium]|nr:MotA/TolQ/ExbB proton channel family protein [Gammaproteobacteria bacterium]MBI5615663.1 MotA/TolQ/ExbB proton channel family protein [Gammaproteobacteria bacterium]